MSFRLHHAFAVIGAVAMLFAAAGCANQPQTKQTLTGGYAALHARASGFLAIAACRGGAGVAPGRGEIAILWADRADVVAGLAAMAGPHDDDHHDRGQQDGEDLQDVGEVGHPVTYGSPR